MRNLNIHILVLLISLSFSCSLYANRYQDRQLARSVMYVYCHKLPSDFGVSNNVKKDRLAHWSINSFLQRSGEKDAMDTVFVISYSNIFMPSSTYFMYNDSILEFAECYNRENSHLSSRKCAWSEIFSKYYYDLLLQWDTVTISEKPRMSIDVQAFHIARIICKKGRCVSLDLFRHDEFVGMIPDDLFFCIICENSRRTKISGEDNDNSHSSS